MNVLQPRRHVAQLGSLAVSTMSGPMKFAPAVFAHTLRDNAGSRDDGAPDAAVLGKP